MYNNMIKADLKLQGIKKKKKVAKVLKMFLDPFYWLKIKTNSFILLYFQIF